ncbi:hypothetical protein SBD_4223 [Streptomyces bottropensis ATCC 25435]|uniref:Uncharacterized protein n=1 Tax=Streptomyces bottropensis ATCC 25435 TaxID=1054862 RepID=M3FNL5_9ACTN|nr:hypothetical protein SBD_4223 [Streptomyces bottropensis ATCC 25435]
MLSLCVQRFVERAGQKGSSPPGAGPFVVTVPEGRWMF